MTRFEIVDAGYSAEDVDQYLVAAAIVSAHRAGNVASAESQESGEFLQSPLAQAAALLVLESVIEAQADRGDSIEIWTISHYEGVVVASTPRLGSLRRSAASLPRSDRYRPDLHRGCGRDGRVPVNCAGGDHDSGH